jgi:hypothetical protein
MNNYNFWQQLLHRIALSSRFMRETAFDFEKSVFLKGSKIEVKNPVFVTGLARAGTTILLEAIHESGEFASLSYSDMPFLMAPNLWRKIRKRDESQQKIERAHGDGIMVNANSPEAFEEVFWQTLTQQDGEAQFKDYIKLILRSYQKQRYLSKNNQNVNRIDILQKVLPDAKILIVFKDPVNHARSLLKQHMEFSKAQQEDGFIKNYMDWIKHSEFGLSYQPITSENLRHTNPNCIDHWLEQWHLLYDKLIKSHEGDSNVVFVNGDLLHSEGLWRKVSNFLEIRSYDFEFRDMRRDTEVDCNQELHQKCKTIYNKLDKISI